MDIAKRSMAIGAFSSRAEAEQAVCALLEAGFGADQVGIVLPGTEASALGSEQAGPTALDPDVRICGSAGEQSLARPGPSPPPIPPAAGGADLVGPPLSSILVMFHNRSLPGRGCPVSGSWGRTSAGGRLRPWLATFSLARQKAMKAVGNNWPCQPNATITFMSAG